MEYRVSYKKVRAKYQNSVIVLSKIKKQNCANVSRYLKIKQYYDQLFWTIHVRRYCIVHHMGKSLFDRVVCFLPLAQGDNSSLDSILWCLPSKNLACLENSTRHLGKSNLQNMPHSTNLLIILKSTWHFLFSYCHLVWNFIFHLFFFSTF